MPKNDGKFSLDDLPGLDAALSRFKPGPGVVGRTAPAAVVFSIVCGGAIWALADDGLAVLAPLLILAIWLAYWLKRSFDFADANPNHSVLEGGELVRVTELEQATKEPEVIDLDAEPSENKDDLKALRFRAGDG